MWVAPFCGRDLVKEESLLSSCIHCYPFPEGSWKAMSSLWSCCLDLPVIVDRTPKLRASITLPQVASGLVFGHRERKVTNTLRTEKQMASFSWENRSLDHLPMVTQSVLKPVFLIIKYFPGGRRCRFGGSKYDLRNLDHWRTQGFGRMRCWLEFKFSGSSVPQARRNSVNLELTFRVAALRRMSPHSAGGIFSGK